MTQIDALFAIAGAIEHLAGTLEVIVFIMFLFLLFKKMG